MLRLAVLLALALLATPARAQEGPLRLVVCAPPGSTTDIIARIWQEPLSERLGRTIIVENRPGAGGLIGAEAVARAPADGRTVGLCFVGPVAIQPHLQRMPYDPRRDLRPVSVMATTPFVLAVAADLGATFEAFLAAARRPNADLSYGTIGAGSVATLAMIQLQERAGFRAEPVIYRGTPQALTDIVAGRIAAMILHPSVALPFVQQGRVAMVLTTGRERHPLAPETPTVVERGMPELVVDGWNGMFAPGGTSDAAVEGLAAALAAAGRDRRVVEGLAREGYVPGTNTPAEFARMIEADDERWGGVIRRHNIMQ